MVRSWQERYRVCLCEVCEQEMNLWFSLGQDWGWDAWWSLEVIRKVREERNYPPIPDFSTFTCRWTSCLFCIYCCFGVSLVTVTYFPVLIDSVVASECYWRLAVIWYDAWLTVKLLLYDTLSEYHRGRGLQGSCIRLVCNWIPKPGWSSLLM